MVRQKFKEAEYFFYQLELNSFNHFLYESYLSAFINATRNISYAIQKEGSNKEGFKKWWLKQRLYMKNDKIMKFFYEIRNYSIKKGTNKLSENKGLTMRHLLEFDGKGNCNVTLKSRNGHSLLKKKIISDPDAEIKIGGVGIPLDSELWEEMYFFDEIQEAALKAIRTTSITDLSYDYLENMRKIVNEYMEKFIR
jgi:hypothetical protein